MVTFVLGVIVGSVGGMVLMAILYASKKEDQMRNITQQ